MLHGKRITHAAVDWYAPRCGEDEFDRTKTAVRRKARKRPDRPRQGEGRLCLVWVEFGGYGALRTDWRSTECAIRGHLAVKEKRTDPSTAEEAGRRRRVVGRGRESGGHLTSRGGPKVPRLTGNSSDGRPKHGNNLSMSSAHLSALEIETWDRAKHSQHDLGMCQTFSA